MDEEQHPKPGPDEWLAELEAANARIRELEAKVGNDARAGSGPLRLRERCVRHVEAVRADKDSPPCPLCHGRIWGVEYVASLSFVETETLTRSGKCLPVVPLVCHGCGFVWLLSHGALPK